MDIVRTWSSTWTDNWIQHHKLTLDSSITELCLWAWLTGHGQMAKDHGRRREKRGREEGGHTHRCPGACLDAWRGSARVVGQRLPEGVFTTAPPGAPHHRRSTHTWTIASTHSMPSEEIRRGVSSAAIERRFSEWDPATDLLAEEATAKSVRWRRKKAQRGAFRPRWQRQSPPEAAGIAGQRQGDSGCAGARVRGREGWGRGAGLGQFDRPRPESVRVNQLGGLGWASGPRPTCIFEPNSKFQTLI
jgi:hypothetical protein